MSDFLNKIEKEVVSVISEFLEVHPVAKGSLFVIGCSSSEVSGGTIGKDSSEEIGKVIDWSKVDKEDYLMTISYGYSLYAKNESNVFKALFLSFAHKKSAL